MVVFSEHERLVLAILGRRKMTIQEISDTFYRSKQAPLVDRNYIAGVVRRIKAKSEKMKLDWTIFSQGIGRGGKTVWRGNVRNSTKRSN